MSAITSRAVPTQQRSDGGSTSSEATAPNVALILATIRTMESGGNYTAYNAGGGASGAYQYIQSTWDGYARSSGNGGYAGRPASQAPPAVQDAVAAFNVKSILASTGGQVAAIPVMWYYPAAWGNPALMDSVPYPGAGNTLTPRQYQTQWLATYAKLGGDPANVTLPGSGTPGQLPGGVPTGQAATDHCQLNLPVVGCVWNSSQTRALVGGLALAGGAVILLAGVAVVVAASLGGSAGPVSAALKAVPGVGSAAAAVTSRAPTAGRTRARTAAAAPDVPREQWPQLDEDLSIERRAGEAEQTADSEGARQFRRESRARRRASGSAA